MNTLIVGDIHGCHAELLDLLDLAGLGPEDRLVSVGDLVDRGPDPGAVIDLFRARPHSVVVCGNHERKHVRGLRSWSQEVCRAQLGEGYAEAVRWMGTLPYHHETPEVRVVHFGLLPGVPLEQVPEEIRAGTTSGCRKLEERLGGRPWWELYEDDVPACFGHHVVGRQPLVWRDRVYGLDTGACHGGRLSGLLLPARRLLSVPARADHWAQVRRAWQGAVLGGEDWAGLTFEALHKKLGRLRADPERDPAGLDRVATWADGVRAALPCLAEALEALSTTLEAEGDDGRAAAAHPAAPWLLRWRAGRLSREHLGCATPRQVQALAAALGRSAGPPAP